MKATVVVHRVAPAAAAHVETLVAGIQHAADQGSDLVMFSEVATTGSINTDQPHEDRGLGVAIPGPVVGRLQDCAAQHRIHVALGLFERDGNRLFDTALLIDRAGAIRLTYRRITSGWHHPRADPNFYAEGTTLTASETDFGSVCFLICGDLFDDALVDRVHRLHPDYLLVPFARSFAGGGHSQDQWDRAEHDAYAKQVKRAGSTTLLVNYLDAEYFGGAFAFSRAGHLLACVPLGRAEALTFAVPREQRPQHGAAAHT